MLLRSYTHRFRTRSLNPKAPKPSASIVLEKIAKASGEARAKHVDLSWPPRQAWLQENSTKSVLFGVVLSFCRGSIRAPLVLADQTELVQVLGCGTFL